jgi:hypothetical protein
MTTELAVAQPLTAAELAKYNETGGDMLPPPPSPVFKQVKIMRESPRFEVDGQVVNAVQGHVVFVHKANQYYSKKYDGSKVPPDCYSIDGDTPSGGNAMMDCPCKPCPHNQWGSAAEGQGKACRNTMRVFLVLDHDPMPYVLKVPPTSLTGSGAFLQGLYQKTQACAKNAGFSVLYPVRVSLSLTSTKFARGEASVLTLEPIGILDPSKADDADKWRKLAMVSAELRRAYKDEKLSADVATEGDEVAF